MIMQTGLAGRRCLECCSAAADAHSSQHYWRCMRSRSQMLSHMPQSGRPYGCCWPCCSGVEVLEPARRIPHLVNQPSVCCRRQATDFSGACTRWRWSDLHADECPSGVSAGAAPFRWIYTLALIE